MTQKQFYAACIILTVVFGILTAATVSTFIYHSEKYKPFKVSFSPSGSTVAAVFLGETDDCYMRIWDVSGGQAEEVTSDFELTFEFHNFIFKNEQMVIVGKTFRRDPSLQMVWYDLEEEAKEGSESKAAYFRRSMYGNEISLYNESSEEPFHVLDFSGDPVDFHLSRDGNKLLCVRDRLEAWDVPSGKKIGGYQEHADPYPRPGRLKAISNSGRFAVIDKQQNSNRVRVFDLSAKDSILALKVPGTKEPIAATFSPHSESELLALQFKYEIQLWNIKNRRQIGKIRKWSRGIGDLEFTRDGRTLAVAANDVSIWDVKTEQKKLTLWRPSFPNLTPIVVGYGTWFICFIVLLICRWRTKNAGQLADEPNETTFAIVEPDEVVELEVLDAEINFPNGTNLDRQRLVAPTIASLVLIVGLIALSFSRTDMAYASDGFLGKYSADDVGWPLRWASGKGGDFSPIDFFIDAIVLSFAIAGMAWGIYQWGRWLG